MKTLKFQKLHQLAVLPSRGSAEACGLDLHCIEEITIKSGARETIRTGLAIAIPSGYYGRVAPRSGLALKFGLDVLAGVIDSDYRGEIICILINLGEQDFKVSIGDRVAQLIIEKIEILKPEWDEKLTHTERNSLGFGSSGR